MFRQCGILTVKAVVPGFLYDSLLSPKQPLFLLLDSHPERVILGGVCASVHLLSVLFYGIKRRFQG